MFHDELCHAITRELIWWINLISGRSVRPRRRLRRSFFFSRRSPRARIGHFYPSGRRALCYNDCTTFYASRTYGKMKCLRFMFSNTIYTEYHFENVSPNPKSRILSDSRAQMIFSLLSPSCLLWYKSQWNVSLLEPWSTWNVSVAHVYVINQKRKSKDMLLSTCMYSRQKNKKRFFLFHVVNTSLQWL